MATKPAAEHVTESTRPRFQVTLRGISLVLVVVGLLISGYLSYLKLTSTSAVCVGGAAFNCDYVESSQYSKLAGIPIAYLGLATYLFIGAALLFENRIALLKSYGAVLIFGITLFAFLFSLWLIYVQAALLQAWCIWCLSHELTMTLLFIISGIRLKQMLDLTD